MDNYPQQATFAHKIIATVIPKYALMHVSRFDVVNGSIVMVGHHFHVFHDADSPQRMTLHPVQW